MAQHAPPGRHPVRWVAVCVLLAVAIAGTLWVPLYARATPKLGPFPFFYAYQLIWIPVSAAVCWVCYLLLRRRPDTRAGTGRDGGRS
jgi:Protein of unknown function (DUF3311)